MPNRSIERRVAELGPKVLAIARKQGRDRDERDEYYVVGLFGAWRALSNNPEASDNYVLQSARNRMGDEWRKRYGARGNRPFPVELDAFVEDYFEAVGENPFDAVDNQIDLEKALSYARSEDVEVIRLLVEESGAGQQAATVAASLGVTPIAAKCRIHRSRMRLQGLLRPLVGAGGAF